MRTATLKKFPSTFDFVKHNFTGMTIPEHVRGQKEEHKSAVQSSIPIKWLRGSSFAIYNGISQFLSHKFKAIRTEVSDYYIFIIIEGKSNKVQFDEPWILFMM